MKKYKIPFFIYILFIIFIVLVLIKFFNVSLETFNVQRTFNISTIFYNSKKKKDKRVINSFSEKYGENITKKIYKNNDNIENTNSVSTNKVVPKSLNYSNKHISKLKEQDLLKIHESKLNKFYNIIIGRYKLDNKHEIDIVKFHVVKYIELNKKNTERLSESDIDDLLLYVSRKIFKTVNDHMKRIQIGQFIINNSRDNKEIQYIYEHIVFIASNNNISVNTRMNAIDILYLSNNSKYIDISKQLLKQIRNIENTNDWFDRRLDKKIQLLKTINTKTLPVNNTQTYIPVTNTNTLQTTQLIYPNNDQLYIQDLEIFEPPIIKKSEKSIYQDGQNVHDTSINNTVLETANELISNYTPNSTLNFNYALISGYSEEDKTKIEVSLHRIMTDNSNFKYGITLYKLFQSLLCFISKNTQKDQRDELNKRLTEELLDMHKTCATGHLSRMVNVLQGFDTNLKQKISISIDSEIYAKIKFIIEKEIQNAENSDEIIDDMMSDEKLLYIDFIKNIFNKDEKKIKEIYKEYENVKDEKSINTSLIKALDKFTGTSGKFTDI